jgi:hypothetical protein
MCVPITSERPKDLFSGNPDMIIDNDPPIERHISVPRDMSQLSCSSFTAGIVEAVLDGLGFVSFFFLLHFSVVISHFLTASARYGPQHADGAASISDYNFDKTRQICT